MSVALDATSNPARLVVEVADTGPGMGTAGLDRVFEAFVQAAATLARRFGGAGLGLAICARLVDRPGVDGLEHSRTNPGVLDEKCAWASHVVVKTAASPD